MSADVGKALPTKYFLEGGPPGMSRGGSGFKISNILVSATFIVALLLHFGSEAGAFAGQAALAEQLAAFLPRTIIVCCIFFIVSHGYLFFVCDDPVTCDGDRNQCDLEQTTAFNTLVLRRVNSLPARNGHRESAGREMAARFSSAQRPSADA